MCGPTGSSGQRVPHRQMTPSLAPRKALPVCAARLGVLGWGLLAWTVVCAVWLGPTACEWWRDYHDLVAWRETGGPPYPRRADSFIDDLPIKVGFALVVPAIGYAIVLALAGIMAIARRHARVVFGEHRSAVR